MNVLFTERESMAADDLVQASTQNIYIELSNETHGRGNVVSGQPGIQLR